MKYALKCCVSVKLMQNEIFLLMFLLLFVHARVVALVSVSAVVFVRPCTCAVFFAPALACAIAFGHALL